MILTLNNLKGSMIWAKTILPLDSGYLKPALRVSRMDCIPGYYSYMVQSWICTQPRTLRSKSIISCPCPCIYKWTLYNFVLIKDNWRTTEDTAALWRMARLYFISKYTVSQHLLSSCHCSALLPGRTKLCITNYCTDTLSVPKDPWATG